MKDLLKRFGLEICKLVGTPMIIGHELSSKYETPIVEQKTYRSMVGGLQYLTHIRLDIENAVDIVAWFQADPKEPHYVAVKRILRYLKCTTNFGLWYDRSNDFTLCAYTYADWAGSMDDRKSTTDGAFSLEEDWFLGWARNKIVFYRVQQK